MHARVKCHNAAGYKMTGNVALDFLGRDQVL